MLSIEGRQFRQKNAPAMGLKLWHDSFGFQCITSILLAASSLIADLIYQFCAL